MISKVIVNGATGRMGQLACRAIEQATDFELVAGLGRQDDLKQSLSQHQADIVIDFTLANVVYQNAKIIIDANIKPVIGTSGLNAQQITALQQQCKKQQLGGAIIPNFAIGVVLMMKYAKDAARYFQDVEIIEMHHATKQDAPSGTALKTAELLTEQFKHDGQTSQRIPIHSVRLPGLLAHQQVIFGSTAETLTIRHDTNDRACFMPGLLLTCRKVLKFNELVYGLEGLLD